MLLIRDIDDKKANDVIKKEEKAKQRAELGLSEEEEEELVLDIPQPVVKPGRKKKVEIDPEIIEAARKKALLIREIARYGRTWVWENYFCDDDDRRAGWLAGAMALRRINDQVLEDLEDFLILKGFNSGGSQLQVEAITARIQKDLNQKRARQAMENATNGDGAEEEKKEESVEEMHELEDKRRKFMDSMRPHMRIWNFKMDDEETKVPHVLRANANPAEAYIDGRIQDLLVLVEGIGCHLRMHNDEMWRHLNAMTLAIFQAQENDIEKRMEAY